MSFINDIVINITKATKGLSQKSTRPLIVGSSGVAIDYAVYFELTDVTDAGYATSSPEYLMASAMLAQSPRPKDFAIARKASATAYTDFLTTLRTTNDGWRQLLIDSRTKADLQAVGTWANSNKKFFFGCCSDLTALDARNVDRESYIIHDAPTDYPDAALVGLMNPKTPGSATYKWKQLNGQNAAAFTSTQFNTIRSGQGIALQEQSGAIFTNEGCATSGEFIDIMDGMDWVEEQLTIELLLLVLNNDKISMDNDGIAMIESVIRKVLKKAGDNDIVARATTDTEFKKSDDKVYMSQVTVPQREDLSTNDLATRNLTGVEFVYYVAGAVHKTTITGLITV